MLELYSILYRFRKVNLFFILGMLLLMILLNVNSANSLLITVTLREC